MNKNILIVIGGALAVALLVAVLVSVTLGGKKDPVIEEAKVDILVAAKDLGIGRELQVGDTRWQEWPQSSVFPGAVVREKQELADAALKGRLGRNVASGEPVLENAILGEAKGNFVAASLEPGQRAVAIEVSAASMVGGFIGPGDYVDVMLTYKMSVRTDDDNPAVQNTIELNLQKTATETILQNVKVLAVDQRAEQPEDGKIKVGKTVTLAVSAQDAERVSLAGQIGEITLSLRGVGDDKLVEKNWETISDARLTNIYEEVMQEVQKVQKDSGIDRNIVRIYNGNQVQGSSAP
ncbi:MAG: Flp pilus assembly protein CpaB [Alphaproteobacteria bacterium]